MEYCVTQPHRGVLFLDKLSEFSHMALESLRQPMEDKVVTISRVHSGVRSSISIPLDALSRKATVAF